MGGAASVWEWKYDLRLMSPANDVSGIPTEGKNLIIVAAVNRCSTSEYSTAMARWSWTLMREADGTSPANRRSQEATRELWPPHELTGTRRIRLITAVTSIVGQAPDRVATLQGRRDAIFALAFDEDGSILTVNRENHFQRWKNTGEHLSLRGGSESITTAAAISPDRAWVVTGGTDGSVRLWAAETGQASPDPDARNGEDSRHTSEITSVAFSPDGKLVVTSSLDRTARVWRIELPHKNHASSKADQRVLVHHRHPHEDIVTSARFSPDGRFVVTTCGNLQWMRQFNDRVAKLLPTGDRAAKPVPIEGCKEFVQARARQLDTPLGVNAAIFAGDGQRILLACGGLEPEHSLGNSNVVLIVDFDPRSGKLGEGSVISWEGHSEPVVDVAISGDGRRVITGSVDNTARVWEPPSGN